MLGNFIDLFFSNTFINRFEIITMDSTGLTNFVTTELAVVGDRLQALEKKITEMDEKMDKKFEVILSILQKSNLSQ